jgi:hypothetical protein
MAAIIDNGELIAAPATGPLRYGLFSAATVTDDLGARGIASGFQLPAEGCGIIRTYDANCNTSPAKTFDEGLTYMDAAPYWLYATRKCGSVGKSAAEMAASVRTKFLSLEQHQVEAQLWGGTLFPTTPSLTANAGTVTVVPSAAGAGAAIAALEDEFYETYGYVGTIHLAMSGYAAVRYAGLVDRQGGTLVTPMGSVWSFGSGYGITGPGAESPTVGSAWAFMTPPVLIRRSELMVPDVTATMDRSLNQYMALAERVYAHTWVCDTVFAVEVPLAAPGVVTVGP